jgi:predicted NUDIX family NTP pyrophosphohydrolase
MSVHSCGILLFQRTEGGLRVLLAHPGGPFWAGKDDGAWSVPKGLPEQGETALETARREFREETGFEVEGSFIPLGELKQPGGKIIHAWALEHDLDVTRIRSMATTVGQCQGIPRDRRGTLVQPRGSQAENHRRPGRIPRPAAGAPAVTRLVCCAITFCVAAAPLVEPDPLNIEGSIPPATTHEKRGTISWHP